MHKMITASILTTGWNELCCSLWHDTPKPNPTCRKQNRQHAFVGFFRLGAHATEWDEGLWEEQAHARVQGVVCVRGGRTPSWGTQMRAGRVGGDSEGPRVPWPQVRCLSCHQTRGSGAAGLGETRVIFLDNKLTKCYLTCSLACVHAAIGVECS